MFNFNLRCLLLILATASSFTTEVSRYAPSKVKIIRWAVQKTGSIVIEGSSNVNTFGCDIKEYNKPDTICYSEENADKKPVALSGVLKVDISKFDCHNRMLTSDLRKTLKANEYPMLVIHFLSLERIPLVDNNKDCLKGWVEIDLAGSSQKFEISYSFIKLGPSSILLNGKHSFNFSDFNLTPPNRLGGLIRVKNKFDVDFNLSLVPVE